MSGWIRASLFAASLLGAIAATVAGMDWFYAGFFLGAVVCTPLGIWAGYDGCKVSCPCSQSAAAGSAGNTDREETA